MGLFDFLKSRPKNTASIAKERLRIIVAQERSARGTPDYLPLLRREILEVIRKYVSVDQEAIDIQVQREGDHEVLELTVALPEKAAVPAAGGA
jgi:cell division topological specificity factor